MPFLWQEGQVRLSYWFNGAVAIAELLGPTGVPVEHSLAASRARTCLKCRCNVKLTWLGRLFYNFLSFAAIRYTLIAKKLKLRVDGERDLGVCSACMCPLKLKVHVPITHIVDYTNEETMAAFHPHCWILAEMQ